MMVVVLRSFGEHPGLLQTMFCTFRFPFGVVINVFVLLSN